MGYNVMGVKHPCDVVIDVHPPHLIDVHGPQVQPLGVVPEDALKDPSATLRRPNPELEEGRPGDGLEDDRLKWLEVGDDSTMHQIPSLQRLFQAVSVTP